MFMSSLPSHIFTFSFCFFCFFALFLNSCLVFPCFSYSSSHLLRKNIMSRVQEFNQHCTTLRDVLENINTITKADLEAKSPNIPQSCEFIIEVVNTELEHLTLSVTKLQQEVTQSLVLLFQDSAFSKDITSAMNAADEEDEDEEKNAQTYDSLLRDVLQLLSGMKKVSVEGKPFQIAILNALTSRNAHSSPSTSYLAAIISAMEAIVDGSRYISALEERFIISLLECLFNLTVDCEDAKIVIFQAMCVPKSQYFLSPLTQCSSVDATTLSSFSAHRVKSLWNGLLVEVSSSCATTAHAMIYSLLCDSTSPVVTKTASDIPEIYAWNTITEPDEITMDDTTSGKKATSTREHQGVHSLFLSPARCNYLRNNDVGKNTLSVIKIGVLLRSLVKITSSATESAQWVLQQLCDNIIAHLRDTNKTIRDMPSFIALEAILNFLAPSLSSTLGKIAAEVNSDALSEFLKVLPAQLGLKLSNMKLIGITHPTFMTEATSAKTDRKLSNTISYLLSHSSNGDNQSPLDLSLIEKTNLTSPSTKSTRKAASGYSPKLTYDQNEAYADTFYDDYDGEMFDLYSSSLPGWFLPRSTFGATIDEAKKNVTEKENEKEREKEKEQEEAKKCPPTGSLAESEFSNWFLSTGQAPSPSIWFSQVIHVLVMLSPSLVTDVGAVSLHCMSIVTQNAFVLHAYLALLSFTGEIAFENVMASLPVSTCIPKAARALTVAFTRLSISLDSTTSSLWAYSQLPPPADVKEDIKGVVSGANIPTISVPPSRSIWKRIGSNRKLHDTVSNVLGNSGALFTFITMLLQHHGGLLASYPSQITKLAPIPGTSTKHQTEDSLLPPSTPFVDFPQTHVDKMNERVRIDYG